MKVLLASWSWYPVGGDWTYVENVKKLYESNGYEVIPFSTKNEKNVKTPYEKYFVTGHDYKVLNKNKSFSNSLKALKNAVVSLEANKNLKLLLQEHEIAFAHLHVIHHWLTPSIIWVLNKHNIPIIWTLHDFKLVCPQGSFFSNGLICEKCINHKFYNCTIHKCKKQSYLASFLASADAYFYHLKGTLKNVNFYLCPTQFLLEKYSKHGFDKNKLVLSNSCYDINYLDHQANTIIKSNTVHQQHKYILYVGRIEKSKGIFTLINAVAGTNVMLKIAGTGSDLDEMSEYVEKHDLKNIQILGFQSKNAVYELTLNSAFAVCPSESYENYPFSVIESLLLSKPVIGSRIGGIPELIIDEITGLLFELGNTKELRKKILKLWNNPAYTIQLGKQAREYAFGKVNFQKHWSILEGVIQKLPIKRKSSLIN